MPDAKAKLVMVAEAVANELRGETFTLNPTVERTYVTVLKLSDLGALRIDVQAGDLEADLATRGESEYTCAVGIAVRKRFDVEDEDAASGKIDVKEIDRLILLVEEIHAFFVERPLSAYPEAVWASVEFQPLYSPQHLREWRQFTGIVALTYTVVA